ncbi:hypothetical protein AgCh_025767 [Apium graveolens]
MEDDSFHVRIYHKGQFQNNSYVGGDLAIFKYVERDRWSYTVLMEYVKDDLGYSEIRGIYTNKEGWKLCGNDTDLNEYDKGVENLGYLDFYVDNVVDHKFQPLK